MYWVLLRKLHKVYAGIAERLRAFADAGNYSFLSLFPTSPAGIGTAGILALHTQRRCDDDTWCTN